MPSATASSLLGRVGGRFFQQTPSSSEGVSTATPTIAMPSPCDDASTIASSVTARSIGSSFTNKSIRSALTQKYAATLASAGAFCFEYLDSRPYRIYTVRTFCESLFSGSGATNATIASVKRYGDHNGMLHRFLIFHIVRTNGRDFYLRMDRRKDPAVPLWVFGMQGLVTRLAKDTVRYYFHRT